MKIVNVAQMQQAERESSRFGISLSQLMENAGKAVAEEIRCIVGDLSRQYILVLVGPGNNGGDGLVAARYLYDWGVGRVKVLFCGKRAPDDLNLASVLKMGIHYRELESDINLSKFNEWLSESTAVLDAFFGTGKSRPMEGIFAEVLKTVRQARQNRPDLQLFALDLPSGLDANSGAVDPATPLFDYTLTLGFPKMGLYNLPAAEHAGQIRIIDIGIPHQLLSGLNTSLMTPLQIKSILPARPAVSHKGTFGRVLVLAGSLNYPGAAGLACAGTIRVGSGLTTLVIAQRLMRMVAARVPEITYLPLRESARAPGAEDILRVLSNHINQYSVLLMGCGIGQGQPVQEAVKALLFDPQVKLPPVVLDADGLNALASAADWPRQFKKEAIFTPHPAEMARLSGLSIKEIQANRIEFTRQSAQKWNKVLVLKGAYTIVAAPDGRVLVSPFANAGLATAGTGDVLAGAIAGLVGQGAGLFEAASAGVYIHALAGEMVKAEMGDAGMIASDLLPVLPKAIKAIKETSA
jgi:ADP-dependent NAD(P)H-hydrate dehydratase / NAD(P)H-hydrate epimerase